MGMDHLAKAIGFGRENNWSQVLRYSDLAATKLKQLKDRPIEAISEALSVKCTALGFLDQHKEQLECAKEWYCLWNTKPTDMGAIDAAFFLIQSCIANNEFTDAHLYASTLYEIINHKHDNKIPEDLRQRYIADGAYYLAIATLHLAQDGGIPAGKKQKAGQEAIAHARRALEIHSQLFGTDDRRVASDMVALADGVYHFNDDNLDEGPRLYEQAKAIYVRKEGSLSVDVAIVENNLGTVYYRRAENAHDANDLDREHANLELALPRYREAARIFRAIGHVENADRAARSVVEVEEKLRQCAITRAGAAAEAAATATTKG